MKDILQDLVAHTQSLEAIQLIKVTSDKNETTINALAEDRSVILNAKTKTPVTEFSGTFGMPTLNKLDIHLKCPEYKENAKISVVTATKDGEVVPVGLHFVNETGDFENNYRFMSKELVAEKLKTAKFKGANWNVELAPSVTSIQKLKFQSSAHNEETNFDVRVEDGDLVMSFGDSSTHAGSFVFQSNINGKLSKTWAYPVKQTLSILGLPGEITMKISDEGVMQISVDSGIAEYNYLLPAQTK